MLPEMALECTTQAPVARAPARACVVGVTGWLGSLLATALTSSGVAEVVSGVSRRAAGGVHDVVGTGVPVFGDLETALGVTCDVVVDATSPEAATRHVGLTADAALSTVLTSVDGATARMVREQWQRRNNGRALVVAPNLSAGFALFRRDVLTLSAVDATGTVLLHDLAGPHVRQPMNATGELAAALMSRGVPVDARPVCGVRNPGTHHPPARSTPARLPLLRRRRVCRRRLPRGPRRPRPRRCLRVPNLGDGRRSMTPYDELHVRPIVNAAGNMTRFGGSALRPEALAAVVATSGASVALDELRSAVTRALARLTRNPGAAVASSGAAAVVLCVLACLPSAAGPRPDAAFDDVEAWRPEPGRVVDVVVHRQHRIPPDRSLELLPVRLVEIGNAFGTEVAQLRAALRTRPAAVLYVIGAAPGAVPLPTVVTEARVRGIPVVADAAAELPPVSNLWHFTRDLGGALAVFSGGKDLGGPQASGLVVGNERLTAICNALVSPANSTMRAMKVGKEQLVGLWAAVRAYLQTDHAARQEAAEREHDRWAGDLGDLDGVDAFRRPDDPWWLRLRLDPQLTGVTAAELAALLWDGMPRVAVQVDGDSLQLTAVYLDRAQGDLVLSAVRALLEARRP